MTGRLSYLWLAWKIIFFKGNPTLQKFSTATAVAAIGIGVTSLLITLGVIDGFHAEIKKRILGISPHVFVRLNSIDQNSRGQEIENIQKMIAEEAPQTQSAPFGLAQAMLKSPQASLGVVLRAVDPQKEPRVTAINRMVVEGRWFSPEGENEKVLNLLLGIESAKSLGVGVGDNIFLFVSPKSEALLAVPKIAKAKVFGIFKSGYYEYDSALAYISLNQAKNLFAMGGDGLSFWIGVSAFDAEKADSLALEIAKKISRSEAVLSVTPWSEVNKTLFSALKLEKIMLTMVISLIIFIASITIASNLIMIAAQKTKMIGSLRSAGFTKKQVALLMVSIGGWLGALGSCLGLMLMAPLIYVIKNTNLVHLPPEIYMIEKVPWNLEWPQIVFVVLFAWILSVAASLLPAYRTAKLEVSQVLRYG